MKTKHELDLRSVVIDGDRVKLAPISRKYSGAIFAEFTDEITRYMMPATPSGIEEVEAFIVESLDRATNGTDVTFAILQRESEAFLGVCALHGKSDPRRPILGIWLKKAAHGHHYGREAIGILIAWARDNIELDHMVYPCDVDNIPSRKIAEYWGGEIVHEGTIRNMSGRILNEVVYKIV